MTKKDYIDIAQQFARTRADVEVQLEDEGALVVTSTLDLLAQRIANVCETDDPRFDRERFLAACEGR